MSSTFSDEPQPTTVIASKLFRFQGLLWQRIRKTPPHRQSNGTLLHWRPRLFPGFRRSKWLQARSSLVAALRARQDRERRAVSLFLDLPIHKTTLLRRGPVPTAKNSVVIEAEPGCNHVKQTVNHLTSGLETNSKRGGLDIFESGEKSFSCHHRVDAAKEPLKSEIESGAVPTVEASFELPARFGPSGANLGQGQIRVLASPWVGHCRLPAPAAHGTLVPIRRPCRR